MGKSKWRKSIHSFLSAGLALSIVAPTLSSPAEAATNTSNLLISEYIE
ncbi:hypothetical protein R4Z10_12830 [Niallia sp. XMNu-256]